MADLAAFDDTALIERVRGGADDAFEVLWKRYYASAFNYARTQTRGNGPDAEDLVTDSYAKVWQTIQRGHGPTQNFRAYLYAVIRTQAADRGPSVEDPTDDMESVTGLVEGTGMVEPTPALDQVARCFYALNERYRRALWLSAVEGLKPAEIGQQMGLDARHVSVLIMRSKESFRKMYVQLVGEGEDMREEETAKVRPVGAFGRRLLGGVAGLAAADAAIQGVAWASSATIIAPPAMPAIVTAGVAGAGAAASGKHNSSNHAVGATAGGVSLAVGWLIGLAAAAAVGLGVWGVTALVHGSGGLGPVPPVVPPAQTTQSTQPTLPPPVQVNTMQPTAPPTTRVTTPPPTKTSPAPAPKPKPAQPRRPAPTPRVTPTHTPTSTPTATPTATPTTTPTDPINCGNGNATPPPGCPTKTPTDTPTTTPTDTPTAPGTAPGTTPTDPGTTPTDTSTGPAISPSIAPTSSTSKGNCGNGNSNPLDGCPTKSTTTTSQPSVPGPTTSQPALDPTTAPTP